MKIQIVNLIPPEYPYHLTRIFKKKGQLEIEYSLEFDSKKRECDLYIVMVKEWTQQLDEILQQKMVVIAPVWIQGVHCWCMPKEFEKELDVEKLINALACVAEEKESADLLQSLFIKTGRIGKEYDFVKCASRLIKGNKKEGELHFFVKEKSARQFASMKVEGISVIPHWLKGIDTEMDYALIQKKKLDQ